MAKKEQPITEELFREVYGYEEEKRTPIRVIIKRELRCTKERALGFLPFVTWIQKYNFKTDFLGDVIGGLTVAVMHIPHGLAYAPLGKVDPVVGLYMAIFPVVIYFFLGTSRHLSLGTFAVVCAMVGEIVQTHTLPGIFHPDVEVNAQTLGWKDSNKTHYEGIEVAVAMAFMVGAWQACLGLLHLGTVCVVMSESLISGYTTGAAIHVFSYQLKNLFGIKLGSFAGIFKLIHIYKDFFSKIKNTNLVTLSISVMSISILLFYNEYVKGVLNRRFPKNKIPVPMELLIIIVGIVLSYFLNLSEAYKVRVVGKIPRGLPSVMVPHPALCMKLIQESLVVALVCLSINISLARLFAKQSGYKLSTNQEFLAYGVSNLFSSFFHCLPSSGSLSRSTIQFQVGSKTQTASLVSMCLIILILLFGGPVFEPVPYCVLSSIVVVTLKGLLIQIVYFPKIWRRSRWNGTVWMGTFFSVVILDLDVGLMVGLVLSILSLAFAVHSCEVMVIGRVPNTNIYLPLERYSSTQEISNILVLQLVGNLNYTNYEHLENTVAKKFKEYSEEAMNKPKYVVLSLSTVTQVDPTAVESVTHCCKFLESLGCEVYITDCRPSVYKSFETCDFFAYFPKEKVLVTVNDAVEYITSMAAP